MKKTIALLLALMMLLALAACDAKDEPSSSPGATESAPVSEPASEEPSEEPSAEASDLEYIKANGKMIIGYTDYAPMNFFDDSNNFIGFDTEFAELVCEKLGVAPDFIEINWDTKEIELNAKSIDCIWNGLTIDAQRAANMSISLPYVKNAQVIVVKADSGYTTTADLVGKTVVAEAGSAGETQVIGNEDAAAEENLANANYVPVAKQTDCLLEVKAGTADAAVLDWTLAKTMVGEGTDFTDLIMIPNLELGAEEYGIAFRKGSDVTAAVDAIIKELVADGSLPALAEKYGLALSPSILG